MAFRCLLVSEELVCIVSHKYFEPLLCLQQSARDYYNSSGVFPHFLQVQDLVDCLQGILTVIPLQLLSFHIAVLRGFDVSTTYDISVDISRLHWGVGLYQ